MDASVQHSTQSPSQYSWTAWLTLGSLVLHITGLHRIPLTTNNWQSAIKGTQVWLVEQELPEA